jgi:hypothetical protein
MGLADLIRGRKKVASEKVDFERVKTLLEEANSRGAKFDVVHFRGVKPLKHPQESYVDLNDSVLRDLRPHELTKDGEWIYRLELEGSHEVYRGKGGEETHYLILNQTLFGGSYRYKDGGKKPHPNHWAKIKYTVPAKSDKTSESAAFIGVGGLLAGLLFLSGNFTGNVIGLNILTSNIIGAGLFVVGLVGGFFWLRGRKRQRIN